MNLKFLPLGTVCSLVGNAEQIMIVGYDGEGADYIAVPYPEGLIVNNFINFDHADVEETHAIGYKSEAFNDYNNKLLGVEPSPVGMGMEEFETREIPSFQFDENGVVISTDMEEKPVALDLQFDENGVVISSGEKIVPPSMDFQFDENGVVISGGEEALPSMNFQFDENGVVISDGRPRFPEEPIVEDSHDVVTEEILEEEVTIQFDEDGMIITESSEEVVEETIPEEEAIEPTEEKIEETMEIEDVDAEETEEIVEVEEKPKKKKGLFDFFGS